MTMGRLKLAGDTNSSGLLQLARHDSGREKHGTKNTPTFSEQDSLIGREFALNGELQQVVTSATDVLFVLFVPSEPP